jgi:protein KTI12
MRYEEPSSMVRWDSPLFTVAWDDDDAAVERTVTDIWNAVTTGVIKKANPSVVPVRPKFTPCSPT